MRNFKHGSLVSNVPSNTHIFRCIPTFRFKLIFTFLPKLPVPSAVSRLEPSLPRPNLCPQEVTSRNIHLAHRSARLSPGEIAQWFLGPSPGFHQRVEQAQGLSNRQRAHDRVSRAKQPILTNRINGPYKIQSIQKSSGRKILPELYLSG